MINSKGDPFYPTLTLKPKLSVTLLEINHRNMRETVEYRVRWQAWKPFMKAPRAERLENGIYEITQAASDITWHTVQLIRHLTVLEEQ